MLRQSAVSSSATQHVMLPELCGKWGTVFKKTFFYPKCGITLKQWKKYHTNPLFNKSAKKKTYKNDKTTKEKILEHKVNLPTYYKAVNR